MLPGDPCRTQIPGQEIDRNVVSLTYPTRPTIAVLPSLDPQAAATKDAVAWSALNGSWSHGQSDRKHDSLENAVDALIAVLGRAWT